MPATPATCPGRRPPRRRCPRSAATPRRRTPPGTRRPRNVAATIMGILGVRYTYIYICIIYNIYIYLHI
jgi:hypothetical protein